MIGVYPGRRFEILPLSFAVISQGQVVYASTPEALWADEAMQSQYSGIA